MTVTTLARQCSKTFCAIADDVDRAKTTHAHKEKPSKMLEQTRKHDIAINMPKEDQWSIKQNGCEDSTRAHGMSLNVCDHQGENPRKALKFGCKPNLGGCCSSYNKTQENYTINLHD